MRKAVKVLKTRMAVKGTEIPVKVYFERRHDIRFSVTGSGAFLRLPHNMPQKTIDNELTKFKDWLQKTAEKQPSVLDRFKKTSYEDGDILKVGKRDYRLSITYEHRKTHAAKIKDGAIYLRLSLNDTEASLHKAIRTLLSRCIGIDFLPEITERIHYWNDRHFKQPLRSIRFKLNQSNWGSCSAKGNINLSTRLLFAPPDVIDYVIVHELAHRIEFNHSPKFWSIVSSAIPGYKVHERWLKENGHLCQF